MTYLELPLGFVTQSVFWGWISFIPIICYPSETLKTMIKLGVGEKTHKKEKKNGIRDTRK